MRIEALTESYGSGQPNAGSLTESHGRSGVVIPIGRTVSIAVDRLRPIKGGYRHIDLEFVEESSRRAAVCTVCLDYLAQGFVPLISDDEVVDYRQPTEGDDRLSDGCRRSDRRK